MKHVAAIVLLVLVSGCATQPKPCTAEWIDWKTERFFSEFAQDHRKQVDDLRVATAGLDLSGERSAGEIAGLAITAARALALGADFMTETVPELNQAISQCGSPPLATQLFASFLRREGFGEDTVKAIEDLGVLLDREG